MTEAINFFATEYKDFRGLKAITVYINGPPYSGKTMYAKRLAEEYELHYLDADQITAAEISVMVF
jgi:adenylate kinase